MNKIKFFSIVIYNKLILSKIVINNYKNLKRRQSAAWWVIRIKSAIDIRINVITKNYSRIIKVQLKYLQQYNMTLLRGHETVVIKMEDSERTIDKVEKWYELATKVHILRLHLKGETFVMSMHLSSLNP